ncbi:MAG: four helix bundle protein, partial [Pirellulaceae bacterium]
RLAPLLPREETYGMRSQITRSAASVPANIAEGWTRESVVGYPKWSLTVPLDAAASQKLVEGLATQVKERPYWQSISKIQSRVAGQMQRSAILALLVSMLFIIAYIWF